MPRYSTPLLLAVVGGVTAWFVVPGNYAGVIGAVIGGLIAGWWIEKKKREDAAEE